MSQVSQAGQPNNEKKSDDHAPANVADKPKKVITSARSEPTDKGAVSKVKNVKK